MRFFHLKIKGRLILICAVLVIVPILTLGTILYVTIQNETALENETKLRQQSELLSLNAESIYEIALDKVKTDLKVARKTLNSYGDPTVDEKGDLVLYDPVGDRAPIHIAENYAIVDEIRDLLGGTATIFQLKSFEGEKSSDPGSAGWAYDTAFYRISTNVIKDDGNRAIGTIVSKPVFDTIMKGETFFGRAWVVNGWYMTAYEPLYDERMNIIGILYVGVREEDYQNTFLDNIASQVVGKTGYISVLNSKGEYVLSLNHLRDGESIINATDSNGVYFIKEIVDESLSLKKGETGIKYYDWKNTGETRARRKFTSFSYFPQWDWIISPGAYVDDFQDGLIRMRGIILLVGILSAAAGIVVAYFFANSIAKPLKRVAGMADVISRGDLNVEKIEIKRKDEIAMLADSFSGMLESFRYKAGVIETIASGDLTQNIVKASEDDQLGQSLMDMNDSLNGLLNEITQTVNEVNNGAEHVSNAGQELSQGAMEQASSLEEISSSLTRINSQTRQNADSAMEASSLAKTAAANAEKGNGKMEQLLEAMNKIEKSSQDISKIVKVIDDIAFQINLLALNANVEAARAGKYGKGFAVVADEVRNLANRSADAAKETTAMVEASGKNVKEGKTAAEETASQLGEILAGSIKVAEFLMEISRASTEQAEGINDINAGLEQIDQVTQSNSSSAEESASAGEELAAQAAQLKGMLEMFRLSDSYDEKRRLIP
ncbi:methyl-accepting chemotaxis protein [Spirochaeta isovalerica]|uniref:Methyl-accepting chemotaxis protein n=1 Tax=Spirochaeta isovalerica TaxID=150 RepID=A0A841RAV7_9SPIO|nr:Cache 3/Cache 2 fusion domain-containing protein [Spirochaeta isovalerica]MBB6480491.1 methyl-accepting chemotaxis protein [Spirochaeta isovalerica]